MTECPVITLRRPRARRAAAVAVVAAAFSGLLLTTVAIAALPAAAATGKGDVFVIHGILGQTLDIAVDDDQVLAGAKPKSIVGPLRIAAGKHTVSLTHDGKTVAKGTFQVRSGRALDVVAHLRSDAKTGPVITTYRDDLRAVGPGKVRLSVAHTAAAPPADIRVNGDVVFSNVANGDTLTTVVPAGTYKVDIVPAATEGDPILGPVDLPLKKGTLTKVYAIGSVADGSMDAIVHTLKVKTSGAAAPASVPTGDGGQAAVVLIGSSSTTEVMMASAIGLLATAALTTVAGRRMRRRVPL